MSKGKNYHKTAIGSKSRPL